MFNSNYNIYSEILAAKVENRKLLAVLLDPDKIDLNTFEAIIEKIQSSAVTHIFIGGSSMHNSQIDQIIALSRKSLSLPITLFPGDPCQISEKADAILFLCLISGRNPDFLIGHQVAAISKLENSGLEIISTGYLLIDGGKQTAVETVSNTQPMDISNSNLIVHTAQAGVLLGNKLIYLEAGSGANSYVPETIVSKVSSKIPVPLIIGGGIKSHQDILKIYQAGADLIVIGTAFEDDSNFFDGLILQ
ncbi:MAG: geranylgeranylglyceryl/heptaprenylglyceryl phosphate synthase [Flavobacterium sp.]